MACNAKTEWVRDGREIGRHLSIKAMSVNKNKHLRSWHIHHLTSNAFQGNFLLFVWVHLTRNYIKTSLNHLTILLITYFYNTKHCQSLKKIYWKWQFNLLRHIKLWMKLSGNVNAKILMWVLFQCQIFVLTMENKEI